MHIKKDFKWVFDMKKRLFEKKMTLSCLLIQGLSNCRYCLQYSALEY